MTNEFKIKRPELDPSFAHEEKRILNLYRSRIEQSNLKEPTFIHMGGLPGAGKTTLAVSYLENELKGQGFIRIDFDDIMTELDGYEESSMINPEQAYDEFWQPAASIGYKINDRAWRVYSDAIDLNGVRQIVTKSVRYGWKESEEVFLIIR